MRRTLTVVLLLASVACASTQKPVATAPEHPSTPAPQHPSTPAPDPEAIRWVRNSAEYHAALHQVYRLATVRVEQAVAKLPAGTWAVVLDADETVLDNSLYQLERAQQGLRFTPESWFQYVKRRVSIPVPAAATFLSRVRTLGGKIAIVTNRLDTECDDTKAVFETHKLAYDAILCRVTGSPSDKNPRFAAVAAGQTPAGSNKMEVVAFVGDNILDFPALSQNSKAQGASAFTEFGVRYFLVPNPMYGSWETLLK